MKKRELFLIMLSGFLLLTNVATYALYSYRISEMRKSSSFQVLTKEESTLTDCINRNGFENKIENGNILVREVDKRSIMNSCY